MNKACSKCKEVKPLEAFSFAPKMTLGRQSQCLACCAARAAKRRSENPGANAARQRAYRLADPEGHKAKRKAYCDANREKYRENNLRWYHNKREKILPVMREYARATRDERREYERAYRAANPEVNRRSVQARKARILAAPGDLSAIDRSALLTSQGNACAYCQTDIGDRHQIDHKTPILRGGTHYEENIHLVCARCNASKGTKTHAEYLEWRVQNPWH